MIYYYFGGKDELYRAVLERAYARIRTQEQAAHFETLQPEQALRAIIGHNFDYHFEHPEFVRLVMNENVHHGEHIAQIESMKQRNQSVIEQLRTIITKGTQQGVFRDGLDPVDLHTTISALSFYNVSNRHTFGLIFKRRRLGGSLIGGIRETQEMLDFCAEHGIVSDIEIIAMKDINTAYERMLKSDVKYRFVIDMATLQSEKSAADCAA